MKRTLRTLSTMVGSVLVSLAIGCNGGAQPDGGEETPQPAATPDAGDAGDEAEAKPVAPSVPLGAEIVVDSLEDRAYGASYRAGRAQFQDAADEKLLRALIAPDLERDLAMKSGTCEAISIVRDKPADGVRDVNVGGKVTLTAPGQDPIPFVRRTTGDARGYSLENPPPAPGAAGDPPVPPMLQLKIELPEDDTDTFQGSWKGVFETAPPLDMKSPDFQKQGALDFPSAGYAFDFAPSAAKLMTATIAGGYAKAGSVCRLDPTRGHFVIPQSILEASKAVRDPADRALVVSVVVWAFIAHEYKHNGQLRRAVAIHRRMQQVQMKVD